MKRKIITAPSISIISPSAIRERLVIEHDLDDSLLLALSAEATDWAEEYMGRPIMSQTWAYYYDCFSSVCEIEIKELTGVVVKYFDTDNAEQTLDSAEYYTDPFSSPAKLTPITSWPSTYAKPNAVKVEATAGYLTANSVPSAILTGVALLVGHLYNNREGSTDRRIDSLPMGVESFLDKYRVPL